MSIKVDPDWWKTLFDDVYLVTDARSVCDDEITCREVDLICELLPLHRDHQILDLCGGHGQHSLELCNRGFTRCTLLDFSEHLIEHARALFAESNHEINLICADARDTGLPYASFDHVLVMGNSLGYIHDPETDRQILAEANRVLRSGGWLLIDLANGAAVKSSFHPSAWHEIGLDVVVCRRRELREDRVCAREMVLSKKKGLIRDLSYSIRLYEPEALAVLLEQVGFKQIEVRTGFATHRSKGDYGFMNHRMLAVAHKP